MNLREKIFAELRRDHFEKDHLWWFQKYQNFCINALTPVESKQFHAEMQKMCDEGLFTVEERTGMPAYRLTESGEKELYNN